MIGIKVFRRHVCNITGRPKGILFTYKRREATFSSDNPSLSRLLLSELGMIFCCSKRSENVFYLLYFAKLFHT